MNEEKIKLLCNGIASISDALNINFWDIVEDMEDIGILEKFNTDEIKGYMESL
jgi:hypothetical protein